jgi:hypothetical protein
MNKAVGRILVSYRPQSSRHPFRQAHCFVFGVESLPLQQHPGRPLEIIPEPIELIPQNSINQDGLWIEHRLNR